MSSDVWLRVRIVRRGSRWWAQMSDDVSGVSRHGQRCWAQILMTCQDEEGMDRGVGLRFWWRVRTMKAWIEVLGSDSDDVSSPWRRRSRCWSQMSDDVSSPWSQWSRCWGLQMSDDVWVISGGIEALTTEMFGDSEVTNLGDDRGVVAR
jgi:hypothetical protein